MAIMRQHRGMTLLEVLVSVVLLSVGMLGIGSMLLLSSKTNNSSYAKHEATHCIYDMFDRIRANPQVVAGGSYNASNISTNGGPGTVTPPAVDCTTNTCNPSQMAAYDTWYWLTRVVSQLPSGSGSVTTAPGATSNTNLVTITVQWDDSIAQGEVGASSSAGSKANFVQLRVQSQI